MRRLLIVLILMVLLIGVVYSKTQITLYTSVPKDIVTEVVKSFQEKNPDIEVIFWRSGTSKVMAKILAEMKTGGLKADVIWTAEPSYFLWLKEKGVLMKYVSPEAKNIPDIFKDKDGYFIGTRVMSIIIAYNTDLMKKEQVPRRWEDILKYAADAATTSPLYSGSNLVWVYTMVKLYGWDFFEKLRDGGISILSSNTTTGKELANGSYKLAFILDYTVRKLKVKGSHVDVMYPEENNVLIWSPIAIVNTTQNPEAAKKFVDFVLSKEGQKILVNYGQLIPVRGDVQMPVGVPSLDELLKRSYKIDWNDLKKKSDEIKDTFADIFE
ncbi:MAG: ABC transporter substrate-binding protein [Thermotoga sp.]|nr:MAG: ABC transporter substrate-binding protein [Thermotoga sp.]